MSKNILIADDDPVVQQILSAILMGLGHQVSIVSSGAQCFEFVQDENNVKPNILFLDFYLGDCTGPEVLLKLQNAKLTNEMKVVLLTANAEGEMPKTADVKADLYLQKPFTPSDIQQLMAGL